MEKLTIRDIATMAKVSTATVSNYLNGNYDRMSLKTRKHLNQIISHTNFRPNSTARNLAKNENKTIGVSIADITNPFTSQVLSGIYEQCDNYNYRVLFTNAANSEQKEIDNITRLKNDGVAGIIVDPVNPDSPIYQSLSNQNTVMVDRQSSNLIIDTVATDNMASVQELVQKMQAKHYDNLYFVTWPFQNISTRTQRYQGFIKATHYSTLNHLVAVPHHGKKVEYQQFTQNINTIMEQNTTAKIGFFCMNARVLLHLLRTMQQLNFSYPEDYGVATYEEFDWMQVMTPPISCIQQNSEAIGKTAMHILRQKLEHKQASKPQLKLIPTKQILHDSF
ncbi:MULTISPECIES: substrate-binding domain-containing protein [unclassified Lactobacillus]|uniref:LacI family DNA-binding transcriptional regulator n=1 Tax=unclassified Lactobacillus TaxID=2620435 RepID=UPI000EFA6A08|nr:MULTISPECIES: substrate-binding domain-containing protein [unclassified Lactobacillus]RMC42358.1 LacI family DNA-binding transcriptional regulator [Lactobacillus sp. ESL0237]RMC45693.1 LacI family DNA-binding transcriptional regulator [Lactobacillus sp. ESL0234]RMC47154.1 LacI family DNA-binding transcriptional regulator [Lactobacillus sp. ESL0236]RMC47771.1 LacI family DNA-binding transcriptional regulator [Lactobacillus sp. ESL0230]